jgi:hypothetical protein
VSGCSAQLLAEPLARAPVRPRTRSRRRLARTAALVALAFVLAQLVVPAYACTRYALKLIENAGQALDEAAAAPGVPGGAALAAANEAPYREAPALASARDDAPSGADAGCTEHEPEASLVCFKHCHPDAESYGSSVSPLPAMAPPAALALSWLEPHTARVRARRETPGLPPPPLISFCRLLF